MADEEKSDAKHDTEGLGKGVAIKLGTDSSLALIKYMLRQQSIQRMREQQARDAEALVKPTITDKDLAQINVITDAAVREAKATGGRGLGGLDEERIRVARDIALQNVAALLSQKQAGEIQSRATLGKTMKERSGVIGELTEAQRVGVVDDISTSLANPEVEKALGKLGEQGRKKDTKKVATFGAGLLKAKQEVDEEVKNPE